MGSTAFSPGRQSFALALATEPTMDQILRDDALKALDRFVATYQAKYPKALECLLKDKDELLAFYDFPAEHWRHLRTSNPIESCFSTVRWRTVKTQGGGSRATRRATAFKLVELAQLDFCPFHFAG